MKSMEQSAHFRPKNTVFSHGGAHADTLAQHHTRPTTRGMAILPITPSPLSTHRQHTHRECAAVLTISFSGSNTYLLCLGCVGLRGRLSHKRLKMIPRDTQWQVNDMLPGFESGPPARKADALTDRQSGPLQYVAATTEFLCQIYLERLDL